MLPWNPPASLSMQQGQGGGGGGGHQNELHSIGMQHQQQQGGMGGGAGQHFGGGGQQQQQQMLQQQQQQQQGGPQGLQQQQQQNGSGQGVPGQQNQQPQLSLSQVLHFLQTEWRRYERERNEWEIERGEMRARIALLEGERRGTENLKTDLMRRVKMLEYALRTERNKYLTTANQQNALYREKDAQSQKAAEDKEKDKDAVPSKEGASDSSPKEAAATKKDGDEKEKPSAITQEKKKIIKEQTAGASGASDRASPAATAATDDGAAGTGLPDVVVSTATAAAAAQTGASQQQPGTGVQRVSSAASLVSMPNGHASANLNAAGSNTMNLGPLSWNPSLGRDPRGRAKSREYLKQCLQEITYLTSATSLNPLPERTPAGMQRPRKQMMEAPAPPQQPAPNPVNAAGLAQPQAPALSAVPEPQSAGGNTIIPLPQAGAAPPIPVAGAPVSQLNMTIATPEPAQTIFDSTVAGATPGASVKVTSPNSVQGALPAVPDTRSDFIAPQTAADVFSVLDTSSADDTSVSPQDAASRLTAIFRPESNDEWRKALAQAASVGRPGTSSEQDQASKTLGTTVSLKDLSKDSEAPASARLRSDTLQSNASSATIKTDGADDHKTWKPRRTLRAHLDAVRCLAFDRSGRSEDICMATGGDDYTVKLWRVPLQSISAVNRTQPLQDSEPALTYRGHTAPVTAVCMSSTASSNRIYSSSLDSTIQIWRLPPRERETYAPFDASLNAMRLEGHTDGVWDVCLLNSAGASGSANGPTRSNGADPKKELLASASADGTVKIWDVSSVDDEQSSSGGALRLSWTAAGVDGSEDSTSKPVPTSLALCQTDMTKLAVAYQDGKIRLFDTETGKLVMQLNASDAPTAQVNRIVSHPTLPMLITANEDNHIRLFDLKSGQCTYSLVGHTDVVTSLDVDPSGLTIASASHDCTVRFWDLLQTRSCIQEISNSHRQKANEGVLDVKYHPTMPFVASSGADGGVRIYG